MSTSSLERINVNFPRPVLEDLRKLVPAKRRSEVIARATARELRRLKLAALFEELSAAPAWKADDYAHLADPASIDLVISRLRASGVFSTAMFAPLTDRRKARRE